VDKKTGDILLSQDELQWLAVIHQDMVMYCH